ncbi:MAG: hypothetical protein EBY17_12785 [Acidobacteriia bacterium]|nr:hypothetical protein [Terriglobia bacterium]
MDRDVGGGQADGAERSVEVVLLAVGPEAAIGHPIGPRREERNTAQAGAFLELSNIGRRHVQNVLAVNLHFIGTIANGGGNGDLDSGCGVGKADDVHTVIGGFLGCVVLGKSHDGEGEDEEVFHIFFNLRGFQQCIADARTMKIGHLMKLIQIFALVLAGVSGGQAADPKAEALDLFYNMDFDDALAAFEKILAATPNDAEFHNHVAHTLLFRELLRNGALESQMVSGNNSFIRRMKMEPPAEVERRFFAEIELSMAITQAAITKNPRDTRAMQTQATAYALRANYGFLVRKSWLASLGDSSKGYKLASQVVQLDPKNTDALLLVGGYDYIVGSLTWQMRLLGAAAGFHGDKARGLRTLELVGRQGNENKRDAQITLCALYRREGQTARAIPLLLELIETFPRNYLMRFELAQMYAATGERPKALAVLEEIRRRKDLNLPGYTRISAEKIYYETGNLQFWFDDLDNAARSLQRATSSPEQMKELDLNTGALAFMRQGQIYDLRKERSAAQGSYRRAIQFAPEAEAAKESQRYLNTPYKRAQGN